jgi:hypothetical protein
MWVQGEDAYLYDNRPPNPPSMTVFEGERAERRTGLLDASGNPIVAIEETAPIGFGRNNS